jgi:hypothetical protein
MTNPPLPAGLSTSPSTAQTIHRARRKLGHQKEREQRKEITTAMHAKAMIHGTHAEAETGEEQKEQRGYDNADVDVYVRPVRSPL